MEKKKNILWLDDDEVLKIIADQIFASISDHIESYCFFTEGHEALSYLNECDHQSFPDLLLIDLKMPIMDGLEFLKYYSDRFCSKETQTEVYVLTSSVRVADMEKVKAFSCVKDIVIKPLTLPKLNELLGIAPNK